MTASNDSDHASPSQGHRAGGGESAETGNPRRILDNSHHSLTFEVKLVDVF